MDERDQQSLSSGRHELASDVGERVRSIISAAEAAANAMRHEADQAAQVRRRVAADEARRIVEDAKADADAFLAERVRRISGLSDTIVERAESIVARLDRAEIVRRQLQSLADALGESAEELVSDVRSGVPPAQPSPSPRVDPVEPIPAATEALEARPEPAAEPPPVSLATQPAVASEPVVSPEPPVSVEPTVSPVAPPPEPPGTPAFQPRTERPAPAFESPPAPTEPVARAAPAVEPPADASPEVVRLTDQRRDTPAADPASDRREPDDQLGARLVALQMAVAGGNRGDVDAHLRRTFGLADPASILDDVFGQGTDSGKRVAWPRSGDGAA